ncbi:hypothetical protein [Streptomyces acidicola]
MDAVEMETLWNAVIAPVWPALRNRADDDIDRRAHLTPAGDW